MDNNGDAAINASLERLGLDYIDLMILHHSQPRNDVTAYKAMEQAVADGRLKAIGLSNYYDPDDFDRMVNATSVLSAVLQNETHIQENFEIFDFELIPDEMTQIAALDKNERLGDW